MRLWARSYPFLPRETGPSSIYLSPTMIMASFEWLTEKSHVLGTYPGWLSTWRGWATSSLKAAPILSAAIIGITN
jgi:hypothetical protein